MTDQPATVIRITSLRAKPGERTGLVDAAWENAQAAREATGCRSAEVCAAPGDPDVLLVISRWESDAALKGFLAWHQRIAHASLADHTVGQPASLHYPIVA